MASGELQAALSVRKQRSELGGSVFEAAPKRTVADSGWNELAEGQFTPRGAEAEKHNSMREKRLSAGGQKEYEFCNSDGEESESESELAPALPDPACASSAQIENALEAEPEAAPLQAPSRPSEKSEAAPAGDVVAQARFDDAQAADALEAEPEAAPLQAPSTPSEKSGAAPAGNVGAQARFDDVDDTASALDVTLASFLRTDDVLPHERASALRSIGEASCEEQPNDTAVADHSPAFESSAPVSIEHAVPATACDRASEPRDSIATLDAGPDEIEDFRAIGGDASYVNAFSSPGIHDNILPPNPPVAYVEEFVPEPITSLRTSGSDAAGYPATSLHQSEHVEPSVVSEHNAMMYSQLAREQDMLPSHASQSGTAEAARAASAAAAAALAAAGVPVRETSSRPDFEDPFMVRSRSGVSFASSSLNALSSTADPATLQRKGIVEIDDPLSMSSASYFKPYSRSRAAPKAEASRANSAADINSSRQVDTLHGTLHDFMSISTRSGPSGAQEPFPVARSTMLQNKLQEASPDIVSLKNTVDEAMSRPEMHYAELQPILKAADRVQKLSQLSEDDLSKVGWPREALRHMRLIVATSEAWQQSELNAKKAIENHAGSLDQVVEALASLFSAWCNLNATATGVVTVGLGLDWKAKAAAPMVCALLDRATDLLRQASDHSRMHALRLEALAEDATTRPGLSALRADPLLEQSLHELLECCRSLVNARGARVSAVEPFLSNPEVLWRAVTVGDVNVLEEILRQGGLVSGRTVDPQGHSVFWDACAFKQAEVALLLLRYFPPGTALSGIDVCEVHARHGNALLHLISGFPPHDPRTLELFTAIFAATPERFRSHANGRGQTFLHFAAMHLNFRILRTAVTSGLHQLLSAPDCEGHTPRRILDRHLAERHIGERLAPPPPPVSFPSWCTFGAFLPPAPSASESRDRESASEPPFADVTVEVHDAKRGVVKLRAHRIVLAASSPRWRQKLKENNFVAKAGSAGSTLSIDPRLCDDADVVLFAVRSLYAPPSDLASASFRGSAASLLKLVRLCVHSRLPDSLVAVAHAALVDLVHDEVEGPTLVTAMLLEPAPLALDASLVQFVARWLLRSDRVWLSLEDGLRTQVVEACLRELEAAILRPSAAASSSSASAAGRGASSAAASAAAARDAAAAPAAAQAAAAAREAAALQQQQQRLLQQQRQQQQQRMYSPAAAAAASGCGWVARG